MARPALEGIETAVVGRAFAAKFAAPLELADADVELLDRGDDGFVVAVVHDEVGHGRPNAFRERLEFILKMTKIIFQL